jgi:hypothetical protein
LSVVRRELRDWIASAGGVPDRERTTGGGAPAGADFLAVGILGQAAQDTGKIGRYLAIWNVRAARDLAWSFADTLRPLGGVARKATLDAQDQITGVLGRSLLL